MNKKELEYIRTGAQWEKYGGNGGVICRTSCTSIVFDVVIRLADYLLWLRKKRKPIVSSPEVIAQTSSLSPIKVYETDAMPAISFPASERKKIRAFADSWARRGPGRWHQGLNWITSLLTEIERLEEKRGILPPMPVFSYSAKWSEEWDNADKDSD